MGWVSRVGIATVIVLSGLVGYALLSQSDSPSRSFHQARALFEQELSASRFQNAYDLVLAASRIDASNPSLLELVKQFTVAARNSGEERAEDLADSLVARAESLVPFQTPSNVIAARRHIDALVGEEDFGTPSTSISEDSTLTNGPIITYLIVAENKNVPLAIRSSAVEQARQMIEAFMLDAAAAPVDETGYSQTPYQPLLDRIDAAERLCLEGLLHEWLLRRDTWKVQVSELIASNGLAVTKDASKDGPQPNSESENALNLARGGMDLMQEVAPFSKAGIAGARQAESDLAKDLDTLQRYRAWYRNQAVLQAVNEVEENWSETKYEADLRKLANALQEEELLIPYVAERFNQTWNKAFSGLESKRPQAAPEMLKLRFLGHLLPKGESR